MLRPVADRVLVVAPHPDDETIGCGGTLIGLASRGAEIRVLVVTDGEASVAAAELDASETARVRQTEAAAACKVLGLRPPTFLHLPDGSVLDHRAALSEHLSIAIQDLDPEIVFVPWPLDGHPDHRAIAAALAQVGISQGTQIWTYEVWATLPANRIVDITVHATTKASALACHKSSGAGVDLSPHLALGRWRSLFGLDGHGHAEAYLVVDGVGLRSLVSSQAIDGGQP